MCGICGIVNLDGSPLDTEPLGRMSAAMRHRGPDGDGIFVSGNVGFAHRRLSIIDPELGAQPLLNSDKSVWLTYNGEIYNYVELRRELEPQFEFITNSDTEALLHAYEKWDEGCLERLRGMFAFAIHDRRRGRLFLARDRVGIKPLYYVKTNSRFAFSSELAPLLELDFVDRTVPEESVAEYLAYQYVRSPRSIYKSIRKLEPGCMMELDMKSGSLSVSRYWDVKAEPFDTRDEAALLEELNEILDGIMKIYVRSDVPFGSFLSGGVDSSLVSALMARHTGRPPKTFTIGFAEELHSESEFAAQAALAIGSEHTDKTVSPELAEELLARMALHFGEPFGDSSAIPSYYVAQAAAEHVKMVLSGDGGDELFAGYHSYIDAFNELACPATLRFAKRLAATAASPFAPPRIARKLKAMSSLSIQDRHDSARQSHDAQSLAWLMRDPEKVPEVGGFGHPADSRADWISKFQLQDFMTYLPEDVLAKVDRMSMANSLEVRVPLLDHKLVEFAFRLPPDMKLRRSPGGFRSVESKLLLKRSSERFFAKDFLARPKQGFGIPVAEWCSGAFRPIIERELRDRRNPVFEWLRFESVQSVLDAFFKSSAGADRVWHLMSLCLWGRHVERWS